MTPLIQARGLRKVYSRTHWWQKRLELPALDNVDLAIQSGQTMALVGQSGSGKTTLAMCLVGLERPDSGEIWFEGRNLLAPDAGRKTRVGSEIQLVFQDSAGALNPRMSAAQILEEPLLLCPRGNRKERSQLALQMMDQVGLSPKWKDRFPHQFSGGQRQRLAIARALILKPRLVILDEALTGLDLSIQGQIINLLLDLQALEALSYLYISHNLELAAQVADEIAVMYQGRIVERASRSEFFSHPHHPHTQALLRSIPPRLAYGAHGGG